MKRYPEHVEGFVESASDRFLEQRSDYHYYYKLVCSCGRQEFESSIGTKLTVIAQCKACQKKLTVYDLSCYPAASKAAGVEKFRRLGFPSHNMGMVYVMYEYGEQDEDEPFDRNDITWCRVWIENSQGILRLVLDDETA